MAERVDRCKVMMVEIKDSTCLKKRICIFVLLIQNDKFNLIFILRYYLNMLDIWYFLKKENNNFFYNIRNF